MDVAVQVWVERCRIVVPRIGDGAGRGRCRASRDLEREVRRVEDSDRALDTVVCRGDGTCDSDEVSTRERSGRGNLRRGRRIDTCQRRDRGRRDVDSGGMVARCPADRRELAAGVKRRAVQNHCPHGSYSARHPGVPRRRDAGRGRDGANAQALRERNGIEAVQTAELPAEIHDRGGRHDRPDDGDSCSVRGSGIP